MSEFSEERRLLILGSLGFAGSYFLGTEEAEAATPLTPVNTVIPRDFRFPTSRRDQRKLSQAVREVFDETYGGKRMWLWDKRKYDDLKGDIHKRIDAISYWVMQGVKEHQGIHPVDPIWVMAQIATESSFNEFAISYVLAVGPCQFMNATAERYGMVVAGSRGSVAEKRKDLAGSFTEYTARRKERSGFKKRNRVDVPFDIDGAIKKAAAGARFSRTDRRKAKAFLRYQRELGRHNQKVKRARDNYKTFLRANFEGRDIFDRRDAAFLRRFDQRVLYRDPVPGMVKYLAKGLRDRDGNIRAAAAGYNTGPGRTRGSGMLSGVGQVPPFKEAMKYMNKIFALHQKVKAKLE